MPLAKRDRRRRNGSPVCRYCLCHHRDSDDLETFQNDILEVFNEMQEKITTLEKSLKKAKKAKKAPKAKKSGDDLVIIEGIGPKAAEVLVAAGIDTFAKLASTDATKVKEILEASTAKVSHLDPTTWAQQAQLAADGKMDELKKLQDELNGGKAV